jgi:hypothetical protein
LEMGCQSARCGAFETQPKKSAEPIHSRAGSVSESDCPSFGLDLAQEDAIGLVV